MVSFRLNGQPIAVPDVDPHTSILDFLRARGLTGSKEGCAEGECGACAVALVVPHGPGSAYRVVNSCLMSVAMAHGHEIVTIEGLAGDGPLQPVQDAFVAAGGSQCGYCTPGFVMSLWAEQYRPDRSGPCDPHAMAGNLCRCTGYRPIADAARALGAPPPGPLLDRLAQPAPDVPPYVAPGFSRPATVEEAVAILASDPDARPIAGGTDLGVEINVRHRRWSHLVSVEAIHELSTASDERDRVRLGAALPLADLTRVWPSAPPAVGEWLTLFASPLIRHRATLGGNLATASPIGDGAPLLLALDASVEIAGRTGRRVVPLSSFFTGYRETALQPGELLTAILVPKPYPQVLAFYKVSKRRFDDISTVAAAMAIDRDADGAIARVRLAYGGVAAIPLRVTVAEHALLGSAWNEAAVTRAQIAVAAALSPLSDHRGSAAYRLDIAQSLLERCWWEHRA